MRFFTGLVKAHMAKKMLDYPVILSINTLQNRRNDFEIGSWMLDCGSYWNIKEYGDHLLTVEEYAKKIDWLSQFGNLQAAVSQDYLCNREHLNKTGLLVKDHQEMTIRRYDVLKTLIQSKIYIMPVLQGEQPTDYAVHLERYGRRLEHGMWVGVGSLTRFNECTIKNILKSIKYKRPDLKLHGFGLGYSSLKNGGVLQYLESADSSAWTLCRKSGKSSTDTQNAVDYAEKVKKLSSISDERKSMTTQRKVSIVSPKKVLKKIEKDSTVLLQQDVLKLNALLNSDWNDDEIEGGKRTVKSNFKRPAAIAIHAEKIGWLVTETQGINPFGSGNKQVTLFIFQLPNNDGMMEPSIKLSETA